MQCIDHNDDCHPVCKGCIYVIHVIIKYVRALYVYTVHNHSLAQAVGEFPGLVRLALDVLPLYRKLT